MNMKLIKHWILLSSVIIGGWYIGMQFLPLGGTDLMSIIYGVAYLTILLAIFDKPTEKLVGLKR